MNVGDVKGKILIKEINKLRENPIVLELVCFCGYSAILMAKNLGDKEKYYLSKLINIMQK